jgi:hypothetical protein
MHAAIDSEWYWLRKIYELLAAHPNDNPLTDWVVPIASVILAGAAVFVAVMSWRTARSANKITADHWREEREENLLRQRRAIAVDMRDWYWSKRVNAVWDHPDDDDLTALGAWLRRKCDRAGEAEGKRLLTYLTDKANKERVRLRAAPPKERAKAAHPSQLGGNIEGAILIDEWVADPSSIRDRLDAHDGERQRELEQIVAAAAKVAPHSHADE